VSNAVVDDGQMSTGAVLNNGDTQAVQSSNHNLATGGKAELTTINAGGTQTITYGTADHVTVNPGQYASEFGGHQLVSFGGVATNTILSGPDVKTDSENFYNGRQDVGGGSAFNTVVDGGHQAVYESWMTDANGMVIPGSGVQGIATGSVLTNGGEQFVSYGGLVKDTVIGSGGRQLLDGDNAVEQNDHLLPGGSITFVELPFGASANTVTFDQPTGLLTVTEGSVSKEIQLAGNYSGQTFVAQQSSAYAGTEVHLLCFSRGTLIATLAGEKLIESLKVGDVIRTVRGSARPIRWIGSVNTLVHEQNRPVVIRAGAFLDGSPSYDLRVTRGHAFLFGNVLIPIGALENGESIIWDNARSIELYHIELDVHDILLANGAPAESYRDAGNRIGFTSGRGVRAAPKSMPTCLPVAIGGPIVERTRARLIEWATYLRNQNVIPLSSGVANS
jgi:autotransporter passenger strand-loop-strand repeat protein